MPEKFREIIRMADTNVDGTKKLPYALTAIKGVGISLAHAIVGKAGLDPNNSLGFLSDPTNDDDGLFDNLYREQ